MDDYITKPVRMELEQVLSRWLSDRDSVESWAPRESVEQDAQVLNEDQTGLLRMLADGVGTLLSEIVIGLIAEIDVGRQYVARSVSGSDAPAAVRAAHRLKGASANVGVSALAAVWAGMEMQARMGKLDGAGALMERFDVEFARARQAMCEMLVASPGEK